MKIEGWRARWVVALGYWLIRGLARTIRFEMDDRVGVIGKPQDQSYIGALWHNRLLLAPLVLRRFVPQRKGAALISPSRDGNLIAALVERFGFNVVRGSSSRQGAIAMLQLADTLRAGRDVVFTPDGPRGPAYVMGPGIVLLAQKSNTAVVPIALEYSTCWRLGTWDRFIIPRPFSEVRVVFGTPHAVKATTTDQEFEVERQRLETVLLDLTRLR